jgi:hypothetical protein
MKELQIKLLYFLVLHPVARNITIFNENTSVRNQTISVPFITTYTALHVSKGGIFIKYC